MSDEYIPTDEDIVQAQELLRIASEFIISHNIPTCRICGSVARVRHEHRIDDEIVQVCSACATSIHRRMGLPV